MLILLLACTSPSEPPPSPPPPTREEPPPPPDPADAAPWTIGLAEQKRDGSPIATLKDVRTGKHEGYDRVVFELDRVPGWHVEYVDEPVRQCGSGEPTPIAGDGWLEIRLTPAAAHDEAGNATVRERERALDLGNAKELEATCDFEADVTWVIGVGSPNPFRVFELSDPPRVVVDVKTSR